MHSTKYWFMLNTTQRQLINDYLDHRIKGLPIVVEGTVRANQSIIERRREEIRHELSLIIYRIICGRQGKEFGDNIDPEVFDVTDFRPSDVDFVQKGLASYLFYLRCTLLKPFLFYALMRKELETFESDDEDLDREFNRLKKRMYASMGVMPTQAPGHIRNSPREKSVFLTREQLVTLYHELMHPLRNQTFFPQLQFITAFMLFMLLGLRQMELRHLRIEHFELDVNGYIRQDENGYGVARLVVTKGDYSPSHPKYGTLIVPRLVWLLNRYLEELYRFSPDHKGKGYLFRPEHHRHEPERQYSLSSTSHWFSDVRDQLESLSDTERMYLSSHDGRHTMQELVRRTIVSPLLLPDIKRAGEIQIRHNILRKAGSTSENHYEKEISRESYYTIVDHSLNFPWNLEELYEWERQMGYRVKKEVAESVETKEAHQSDAPVIKVNLEELKAEFKTLLKKTPKGWTTKQRTLRLNELQEVLSKEGAS